MLVNWRGAELRCTHMTAARGESRVPRVCGAGGDPASWIRSVPGLLRARPLATGLPAFATEGCRRAGPGRRLITARAERSTRPAVGVPRSGDGRQQYDGD